MVGVAMLNGEMSRGYLSHRLLRILAGRLNARGMETREFRHGDEVIEIAAINPRDPDRSGRVIIGYEGYLVWECWTEFKTDGDAVAAAEIIHELLTRQCVRPEVARVQSKEKSDP
jgi:hypothetical protein